MATYSRTTGTNTNTQTTGLPSVREPVKSMELADVIIHSMEVVTETFENADVPVNIEQITEAINKSDITNAVSDGINKSKSLEEKIYRAVMHALKDHDEHLSPNSVGASYRGGSSGGSGRSGAANAVQSYWEQKKYNDEKKQRDKQAKLEAEERKRREQDITKRLDETFASLNKFSNNPLKGVADGLENGIKKIFTTSLGDVSKHIKKGFDTAMTPFKIGGKVIQTGANIIGKTTGTVLKGVGAVGRGISNVAAGGFAIAGLIKDKLSGRGEGKSLSDLFKKDDKDKKSGGGLADLLRKDPAKKEEQKEQKEQGKVLKGISSILAPMSEAVDMLKNMTLLKFGAMLAIIGGVAVAIPQIVGLLGPLANNIPMYLDDLKIKMGLLFHGENSIGNQLKWAGMDLLQKVGEGMKNSDNAIISSMGKGILGATASGAQEELANQFRQTQAYQTMVARGMKEEDLNNILSAKNSSQALLAYAGAEGNKLSQTGTIRYADKKGNMITKSGELGDLLDNKHIFNDDEGKLLLKKYKAFLSSQTPAEFNANKLTDAEWSKFNSYLWDAKMDTNSIHQYQTMYFDKVALGEWLDVLEKRENGELKTDIDKLKSEAKAKDEETFLREQAASRMSKAQNGGLSLLDFQTDKAWENNPYLKDIKDDYMSKYATELSKGEKVIAAGIEANNSAKRAAGNLFENVTGQSNSWQQPQELVIKTDSSGGGSGVVTY